MPGHYLVAENAGTHEVCYWDLSFGSVEQRTEAEWCEMLRSELRQSTQMRLMSDVPLGAFLKRWNRFLIGCGNDEWPDGPRRYDVLHWLRRGKVQ